MNKKFVMHTLRVLSCLFAIRVCSRSRDESVTRGMFFCLLVALMIIVPDARAQSDPIFDNSGRLKSDLIFDYAEATYPQFLAPPEAASQTAGGYYYRYYPGTGAYVGTADDKFYYLGPASSDTLLELGPVSEWLTDARAAAGEMVFTVTVPSNTPEEDRVFMVSGPSKVFTLDRTGPNTWSIALTEADFSDPLWSGVEENYNGAWFAPDTKQLNYAFTRGYHYLGGEFLAGDPPFEDWNIGRTTTFIPGTVQVDTVERWRWFLPDGEMLPSYPATLTQWLPRLNGLEFEAGVFILDIWEDYLTAVTRSTNQAARNNAHATWAELAPPWDYRQLDPLPIISNVGVSVPAYPTEDALRGHIRDIKADGLKVTMEPQVCCVDIGDTSTRSEAWVAAWFDQYEAFLLYHARIAEEEGADKFLLTWAADIAVLTNDSRRQQLFDQRMREILLNVKSVYSGPIGYSILLLGPKEFYGTPANYDSLTAIADLIDFWGVHFWKGLATTDNASQADLDAEVERVFAVMLDPIYETDQKPQVLSSVAYGSYDGAVKSELSVCDVAGETYFPESHTTLVYDGIEQAMVMQAVMRAVAKRPQIVGIYPFLYQYVAQPLSPDYSIRGKPAEGTLSEWYRLATQRN